MQTVLEKGRATTKPVNGNGAKAVVRPHPMVWTVDEYYKVYHAGVFRGKRVELIRGEIIEMSPMLSPHATSIRLVQEVLRGVFREGFEIRPQMPMSLSNISEPEPDVLVVAGSVRDFSEAHPTTASLLVEVALTSLRFDRTTKMRLYAENNIEEYWIVNLKQRCLEVFRQPVNNPAEGFTYAEKLVLAEHDSVTPLAAANAVVKVSDLLP